MSAYFGAFLTRPLWCALTFVGAVFFAVRVVEPLQKVRPLDENRRLAEAIPERVRTFIAAILTSIKGTMDPADFVTPTGWLRHGRRQVSSWRKGCSPSDRVREGAW